MADQGRIRAWLLCRRSRGSPRRQMERWGWDIPSREATGLAPYLLTRPGRPWSLGTMHALAEDGDGAVSGGELPDGERRRGATGANRHLSQCVTVPAGRSEQQFGAVTLARMTG